LIDSEKDGVGYRVAVSKDRVTEKDVSPLMMPFSDREVFSITPVVAGAGRGTGQILAGLALVTAAVVLAPTGGGGFLGATGSGFLSASASSAIGSIGVSLALSGIATAISPQPTLDTTLDESVQLESFTFSNVVNTSRQGMPCPIAYGRVFVGSAVLSSGLDVDQVQA
jgi:predicted phage tail protein